MTAAMDAFCERLQDRLEVDSSYLTTDIPALVQRCMKRLLRDYNFPKMIRVQSYVDLTEGTQSYNLPDDLKGTPLGVFFTEPDADGNSLFSDPLRRREGFTLPQTDGAPRAYWLANGQLWTDITLGADSADTTLLLVYKSNSTTFNEPYLLGELEDVLFSYSMFRGATEYNKAEIAAVWAALWKEDQTSLAIYTHDLEFGDLDIVMREPDQGRITERYPRI